MMTDNVMHYAINNKFVPIKDMIRFIYGCDHSRNFGRIIKDDPILQACCAKMQISTVGGRQEVWVIDISGVLYFLSKLYTKGMTAQQLDRYRSIMSYFVGKDLPMSSDNCSGYYFSEIKLRDEIYHVGRLDNIRIVDKETEYAFGRIDLLGIDDNNNRCCIELKNKHGYSYTVKQLTKYRDSGCFDRIVYVCYQDEKDDLLKWLKENNIECYMYHRELVLDKVG